MQQRHGLKISSCWLCADYVIPKGCFVVPFLSAVHLDESYYKESLSFNPWRWLDPETQVCYFLKSRFKPHINLEVNNMHVHVNAAKEELENEPLLLPIWWRNSVLSRSRTSSPSNLSLSALLHYNIQVSNTSAYRI